MARSAETYARHARPKCAMRLTDLFKSCGSTSLEGLDRGACPARRGQARMSRRGRQGPRQPGGGRQQAGPRGRGRGHGHDRDERIKERSKERSNPRQSDLRVKHSPKRDGGRGRAFPARPPREQPVTFAPAQPPVVAPKPAQFSAGVQTVTISPTNTACASTASSRHGFRGCRSAISSASSAKARCAVNGKRTQPKTRLEAGQAVRIPPLQLDAPKPRDDAPQAQKDRAFIRSIALYRRRRRAGAQ